MARLVVHDAHQENSDAPIRSVVAVPMVYKGNWLGYLECGYFEESHFWSEKSILWLEAIGEVFAHAIEIQTTWRTEREQRNFIEALLDTTYALTSTLDLDEILDRILGNLWYITQHDVASIILLNKENQFDITRYQGTIILDDDELKLLVQHLAKHAIYKTIQTTYQPLTIPDLLALPNPLINIPNCRLRSFIGIPIIAAHKIIGFLNIASFEADIFTPHHASQLKAFASHAALAIRNASLHRQQMQLAAIEERQQIARDLHDNVSQLLFSSTMMLGGVQSKLNTSSIQIDQLKEWIQSIELSINAANSELRNFLQEVRPDALTKTNLVDLLQGIITSFIGYTYVNVEYDLPDEIILPSDVKLIFYRIIQEIFNNIKKHAKPTLVKVHYEETDADIKVQITDNGIGFNVDQIPPDRHGIAIMNERAEQAKVKLYIESEVNVGTLIQLAWAKQSID